MESLASLFGIDWSALGGETKAALVAVLGTLVVSVVGWVVSAINTRRTLKEQRRLAMEDKVWPRRAETYVEVLEWAHDAAKHIDQDQDLPHQLQSKLAIYATPRVRDAWVKVRTEMEGISGLYTLRSMTDGGTEVESLVLFGNAELGQRVVDFAREQMEQEGGYEKSLRNAFFRLHRRLEGLEEAVREDLNGRNRPSLRSVAFHSKLKLRGWARKANRWIRRFIANLFNLGTT